MRGFFAVATVGLALAALGCGGNEVRTVDDARTAIRKILEGADPSDFKLADDASASARVILGDGTEVGRLKLSLTSAGEKGCDVATVASTLGEKNPEGEISFSGYARSEIRRRFQIAYGDNPADLAVYVDPVLNAMVGLTESSVTEAVDKACDVASSGL